jgi:hypothetical protein
MSDHDGVEQVITMVWRAHFFVVTSMNMVMERRRRGEAPPDSTTKKCPECLSEVPSAARRCSFCAQPIEMAGAGRVTR